MSQNSANSLKTANSLKSFSSETISISSVLAAYFLWGFLVLYFWLLDSVSSIEIVLHRALWATIMLWLYAIYSAKTLIIFKIVKSFKNLKYLFVSATLLTLNWILFVYAINIGDALATSMAYFIAPTIMMAVALVVYKEKLNLLQWLSMIFIFIAIISRIYFIGKFPWLSIGMALSWVLYSMMQRKLTIATIERLTIETTLALPFLAVLFIFWAKATDYQMQFSFHFNLTSLLLIGSGAVTIVPLLLFNFGVKKTPFKWVALMQFIVPSISFLTAIYILGEELNFGSLISFVLIWIAMVCFILAQWHENRKIKKQKKLDRISYN